MNACTIFSHFTDLQKVHDCLVEIYGKNAISIEGESPANWDKLTVTSRKLLLRSSVTFTVLRPEGEGSVLTDMTYKMYHVFQTVTAEKKEIQDKLLVKISSIRLGFNVLASRRVDAWEEAIFGVTKALDGVVFWEGNKMLNAEGYIILDFEGRSRVQDLEVQVESDFVLGQRHHSEAAETRKQQSEEILEGHEVPINRNLPPIADSEQAQPRTQQEIADRALALCLVALKGEGLEQSIVDQIQVQYDIAPLLSPAEQAFVQAAEPTQQERINFAWRYESLWVLLWALNYAELLPYPSTICDVQKAVGVIRAAQNRANFQEQAQLRTLPEILDQADLAYRMHWACVDARLRGQAAPADLENGVIFERHYALNWIRGYQGSDWDAVQTDT